MLGTTFSSGVPVYNPCAHTLPNFDPPLSLCLSLRVDGWFAAPYDPRARSRQLSKASSPAAQEQRYGKAKGVSGTVKMSDVRDSLLQAEQEKVRLSSNVPSLPQPWSLVTGVTEHAPTPENFTPPRPL